MDILSVIGIIIGIGAILLGQYLDGGHISSLINGPALIIVFGGSLGAIMLQSPLNVFVHAMKLISWVFKPPKLPLNDAIQRIVRWSDIARREGLLGLENMLSQEPDAFIQRGIQMLVDGYEPEDIRMTMEIDLIKQEKFDKQAAQSFNCLCVYSSIIRIT